MMNNLISLIIDPETSIIINSKYNNNINEINPYSGELFINFQHGKQLLCIAPIITLWDVDALIEHLHQVLHYQLQVPTQIEQILDLGIARHDYWNQVTSDNVNHHEQWIGSSLILLENNAYELESCVTFLYNDKGNIWLEISYSYPWFFSLTTPPMSYNEWLSHYKIIYKKSINHTILQEWIFVLENFTINLRKHM